jgi:hypothetical protein
MARGPKGATAALVTVSLAATAWGGTAPARLYTIAATETCLRSSLLHAITGLPPATPPSPSRPFVYRLKHNRFRPPVTGQLGAWNGERRKGAYAGVILSFFKSVRAARTHFDPVFADSRIRNVTVEWEFTSVSKGRWRQVVRSCLRTGRPARAAQVPTRPTPQASLATFAGSWGGHTRRMRITFGGRGFEVTDSGCCVRVYRMTFQIVSVSGTLTDATAVYRVVSFKRYDRTVPRLQRGRIGKLVLRNGIVTNTLSTVFFCSEPAWWATGACGA